MNSGMICAWPLSKQIPLYWQSEHHDLEKSLSVSLALSPLGGSQVWCFLRCGPEPVFEQTMELQSIETPWRSCDVTAIKMCCCSHQDHVVSSVEAGWREVIIQVVGTCRRKPIEVVLQPFPHIALEVVEATTRGRKHVHRLWKGQGNSTIRISSMA